MQYLRFLFKRETAAPLMALVFASIVSVSVIIFRIGWTGHMRYAFLIWNLFLAWVPLVFALMACAEYQRESRSRWRYLALSTAWLLFFPNAPYIVTDVVHLTYNIRAYFWIDLVLVLLCAFTGLVLGFVSLYLMQSLVGKIFGRVTAWLFIVAVAALSSFGVYLGRFLRFNSWDVLLRPGRIFHGLDAWVDSPMLNLRSGAFLFLFAIFIFIAYVTLYALTHLSPRQQLVAAYDEATPTQTE